MIIRIPELAQAIEQLKTEVSEDMSPNSIEKRETYLGRKGKFNDLAGNIKTLLPENRKEAGKMLNELKVWLHNQLPQAIHDKQQTEFSDPTLPGVDLGVGHVHPISHAMHEITQIFER